VKVLSWHLPRGTEENGERSQAGLSVSVLRFEPHRTKVRRVTWVREEFRVVKDISFGEGGYEPHKRKGRREGETPRT
jgi:hypothetical protein